MVTVSGQCNSPFGTLTYIMPIIMDKVVCGTKLRSQGLDLQEILGPQVQLDPSRHETNATQEGSNKGKTFGILFTNQKAL